MDEGSRFDPVTAGGLAAAATAAAAGSAVELALPGAGAAVSVAVQSMINFAGAGIERRRRRAMDALDEACEVSDQTAANFLALAGRDDRRVELTMRALTAASQATVDSKVRALGRALASGVLAKDDAIVDQETYVVDALAKLEAPHVKVLSIMERTRVPQENGVGYQAVDLAWTMQALSAHYPQAESILPAVVAALVGIGAISDIAVGTLGYVPAYDLSTFGRSLLIRLREAGLE